MNYQAKKLFYVTVAIARSHKSNGCSWSYKENR